MLFVLFMLYIVFGGLLAGKVKPDNLFQVTSTSPSVPLTVPSTPEVVTVAVVITDASPADIDSTKEDLLAASSDVLQRLCPHETSRQALRLAPLLISHQSTETVSRVLASEGTAATCGHLRCRQWRVPLAHSCAHGDSIIVLATEKPAANSVSGLKASAATLADKELHSDYILFLSSDMVPVAAVPRSAPPPALTENPTQAWSEERVMTQGFLSSLLHTFTYNGGKVAAAECTLLRPQERGWVPRLSLSLEDLAALVVAHKGVVAAAAVDEEMLSPYLVRFLAGVPAENQKAMWDVPISAASMHCTMVPTSVLRHMPLPSLDSAAAASVMPGDWSAWEWSLSIQQINADWQVWSSGAVAVWLPARSSSLPGSADSIQVEKHPLEIRAFNIRNSFGERHYPILTKLVQQERISGNSNSSRNNSGGGGGGAVQLVRIYYSVDFPCTCCGLAIEANDFILSMARRYVISTRIRHPCEKEYNPLVDPFYRDTAKTFFASPALTEVQQQYWRAKAAEAYFIRFLHVRAPRYRSHKRGVPKSTVKLTVGRTLREFVPLPRHFVSPLRDENEAELTPAGFLRDEMIREGVDAGKIFILPEATDVYRYDPSLCHDTAAAGDALFLTRSAVRRQSAYDNQPSMTDVERQGRFVFLSVFKWEARKGWDVLLRAYWRAFGPGSGREAARVTLLIKTHFTRKYSPGLSVDTLPAYLDAWARGHLPGYTSLQQLPHLVILSKQQSAAQLRALYCRADAYISSSRGEGWGLPAAEALSMGKLTLLTNWSGFAEMGSDQANLWIPIEGLTPIDPQLYGPNLTWAEPSVNETASLMQRVIAMEAAEAEGFRLRARQRMVQHFSHEAVGHTIDNIFATLMVKYP